MKENKYTPFYKSLTFALLLSPTLIGLLYSIFHINKDDGAGFYVLFIFILFVPGVMSVAFLVQSVIRFIRIQKSGS